MPFTLNETKINLAEIEGKEVKKKVNEYTVFRSIYKEKQNDGSMKYQTGNKIEIDYRNSRRNEKSYKISYNPVWRS